MMNKTWYDSPIGRLLLVSKEDALVGAWLEGQKYFLGEWKEEIREKEDLEILVKTKTWLDRYFRGEKPEIAELKLAPKGNEFRQSVWEILCEIPYGETTTYGEIAQKVAKKMGRKSMSAQAVGGAVGHNPISIIIPCHRVIGKNGSLIGYAGGVDKKIWLLELEEVKLEKRSKK